MNERLNWTELNWISLSTSFILFSTSHLVVYSLPFVICFPHFICCPPLIIYFPISLSTSLYCCLLPYFCYQLPTSHLLPHLSLLFHLLVCFLHIIVYFPAVILLPPLRCPPPSFCHLLGSCSPLSLWPALNHLFLKKRKIRRFSWQWNYSVRYHNGGYMSWYFCSKFTECTTPRVDPDVNYGCWVVMHQESCHF